MYITCMTGFGSGFSYCVSNLFRLAHKGVVESFCCTLIPVFLGRHIKSYRVRGKSVMNLDFQFRHYLKEMLGGLWRENIGISKNAVYLLLSIISL